MQRNRQPFEDNPCGFCRALKSPPPCRCGGRNSGGSGDENKKDDSGKQTSFEQDQPIILSRDDAINVPVLERTQIFNALVPQFDLEKVREHLSIEIDSERGILTFKGLTGCKKEETESLQAVKTLFEGFLQDRGIAGDKCNIKLENNQLRIMISDWKLYDELAVAFLKQISQHLTQKSDDLSNKNEQVEGLSKRKFSPFRMELKREW